MVAVHLYVEGGGTGKSLRTECRRGFRMLLEKAGVSKRVSKISPMGARAQAYKSYCAALRNGSGERPMLLVDAEAPVTTDSAWEHVHRRGDDAWDKPKNAREDDLHLMVQCMEAWIAVDRAVLKEFYAQGFKEGALPSPAAEIENISKADLNRVLEKASKDTKTKGAYSKGAHSFKLLAMLDPSVIRRASPWAERFFNALGAQPISTTK